MQITLVKPASRTLVFSLRGARGPAGEQGEPGSGGGSSDHGTLTGLADDDHPQYHNNARGDARYSLLAHNHDATYAALSHSHIIGDVTGLQTALDGKSSTSHNHDATYAALVHTHAISDTTGLQTALDGKASVSHNHDASYATISHSHAISDVTNLQTTLDGKAATSHNHDATYAALSHNHDDLYFTEAEVTSLLSGKMDMPTKAVLDANYAIGGTAAVYADVTLSGGGNWEITIPTTGRWLVWLVASGKASTSQTITMRLALGTAVIGDATADVVGQGCAAAAPTRSVYTSGSPGVISGPGAAGTTHTWYIQVLLNVTTAGTIKAQVTHNNGAGSPQINAGGLFCAEKYN